MNKVTLTMSKLKNKSEATISNDPSKPVWSDFAVLATDDEQKQHQVKYNKRTKSSETSK